MKSKLWIFRDINLSQRASLAQALSISPATASLFSGSWRDHSG